jgi:hypothetical protein
MKWNEPYDQFPSLLQKLHGLPQDERVKQLEQELREGLHRFDGLLQEVKETIRNFNKTAGEIRRLDNEKEEP